MLRRNELARLEVIQGCGHAPALMNEQQIALVTEWIGAPLPKEMKVARDEPQPVTELFDRHRIDNTEAS
jgi:hypothetical protein